MNFRGEIEASATREISKEDKEHCDAFLEFMSQTGSPYDAGSILMKLLSQAGFEELRESDCIWDVRDGGKYFVHRNRCSVAAFRIGSKNSQGNRRFLIAAGHTDSPCLRVRPRAAISSEGYVQLGVQTYGGGLWHTWFDRGLGMSGKIVIGNRSQNTQIHELEEVLVRIPRPICIIPNLCVHLQNAEERKAFKVCTETALRPIMKTETSESIGASGDFRLPQCLLELLSKEANCDEKNIVDVDLSLYDVTPPRLCGIEEEFIESGRLDNLANTWAIFEGLISAEASESDVLVAVALDHEEIGSKTWTGADSTILETWLQRIIDDVTSTPRISKCMAESYLISADMAHAVHPNYASKHQAQHKPILNRGIVIKHDENQRYTTHATSSALCRLIGARCKVQLQDFTVRNDSPCGSTIGPMTAAKLGIRAVDIGIPQLAMHSARETAGVHDILSMRRFMITFFEQFSSFSNKCAYL